MAYKKPPVKDRLRVLKKEKQAVQLRIENFTYEQIAAKLGYSGRGSAHKAVERALHRVTSEEAKHLVYIQSEQLDDLHRKAYQLLQFTRGGKVQVPGKDIETGKDCVVETVLPINVSGSAAMIDKIVRIMERKSRLFGLDAPQKIAIDSTTTAAPPEVIIAFNFGKHQDEETKEAEVISVDSEETAVKKT